ncbi:MAG: S-adenosylmethionine decarboxylase [Nanoarchaeota archaeon]|nr:S-adenosylmethionine decarboxylase [Nanoarchaeota archaeon]
MYGKELILDIHNCDVAKFNRKSIKQYFKELCALIDMSPCKLVFWDDISVPKEDKQTLPHTKGTSAVQFILTSNITIHTLDVLGKVFINIFSCKDFDSNSAAKFSEIFFSGKIVTKTEIKRI